MFIHNFKYAMKTMLKNKTAIIWTLLFPIVLGSFMYMAFGTIYEKDMVYNVIPVAVVEETENATFKAVLTELEAKDELLEVQYLNEEEAKKAIENEEVKGIIYVGEELRLEVPESSYSSTVLQGFLNEYKKQETVITDIAMNNPEAMEEAIENLRSEKTFFVEKVTSDGNQNMLTNYFYAVFAMGCLFASFGATEKVGKMQANVSPLGARRCLSPNNKATSIVAEFLSLVIMQFTVEVVALIYFTMIGVDFGNKYPQILLILLFGSCIGISLGIIIGSVSKLSEGMKSGICICTSMGLSVMADLVASGIKDKIEHTAPIINRINPAALIVDSFYALNIYDTYDRYFRNMATLGVMTIILLTISYLVLRRNKYASI